MKTSFTLIIACLLIITSCKKNDVVKSNPKIIHSFEELKRIILVDTSISKVVIATRKLEILSQKNIFYNLSYPEKKHFLLNIIS